MQIFKIKGAQEQFQETVKARNAREKEATNEFLREVERILNLPHAEFEFEFMINSSFVNIKQVMSHLQKFGYKVTYHGFPHRSSLVVKWGQ